MGVPAGIHQTGLCRVETGSNLDIELLLDLPTLGDDSRVMRDALNPDWYACVCAQGPIEHAWQVNVQSGVVRLLTTRDLVFGRSMAYTSGGALIVSQRLVTGDSLFIV